MQTDWLDTLRDVGVDTRAAVSRFADNAGLYRRFLLKFLDDDTFQQVGAALKAADWQAMLGAAHTLKGVAGNLGLQQLYEASSQIVANLRAGDPSAARQAYDRLDIAYRAIRPVLEQLAKEGA